jgi:hypothetical protein
LFFLKLLHASKEYPMFGFLKDLRSSPRRNRPAPGRPPGYRPFCEQLGGALFGASVGGRPLAWKPEVEALEARVVMSTANQIGATLNIVADPGTALAPRTILLRVNQINPTKLDVLDSGTLLGQFTISSITHVNVQVAGNDVLSVNDSNGFPFAPGTGISLFGSGATNKLSVVGSRAITGTELFVAGTATQNGKLELAGSTFGFTAAIPRVADELANADTLQVQSIAPAIELTGTDGVIETLSGLAGTGGGGNVLSFKGKAVVDMQVRGDNATATLLATASAQGLRSFVLDQFGKRDTVNIDATPTFAGITNGNTSIEDPGTQDVVNLRASSGPVNIFGTSSTTVVLGSNDTTLSKSVTSGINGSAFVDNVGVLNIEDEGNATTKENVTVTESTITGTGLFGPGGSLQYRSVIPGQLVPAIFTGQLANTYTVTTSGPFASYNAQGRFVLIEDNSTTAGLTVTVDVTAFSDLDLSLVSKDAAASSLFISAPSGSVINPFIPPTPNGFVQVFAPGAAHTTNVGYAGFGTVHHS